MKDETLEDLMPTINPNLDEVVSENAFIPAEANAPANDEMFICKTKKPLKKPTKVEEVEEVEEPIKVEVKETKKYPHLEKARASALLTRQNKAKAKKELKELEKAEKLRIKEEKKLLRIEKNRTNARNNYRKKKQEEEQKQQEEKEVWKESITNDKFIPIKTGLTYDEFEKYMDTYTNKKALKKPSKADPPSKPVIKPKPVKPIVNKPQVVQSIHPIGYFNPHQRNKIDMDDLFSL